MLDQDQINKLTIKLRSNYINVAREYIQHVFLRTFYSFKESESIYFKGGTALRILYHSPRFSEDLDFFSSKIELKSVENLMQETMLVLDKEGLNLELSESTLTTGGYLGEMICSLGGERFGLLLEISGRKKPVSGQLIVVDNPYIPAFSLVSLKKELLIAEKIDALLGRRKPRDFYDLYFMLRANLFPEKKVLSKIYDTVKNTKINFKEELSSFLPSDQHRIIKDFKNILLSEIERYIGR